MNGEVCEDERWDATPVPTLKAYRDGDIFTYFERPVAANGIVHFMKELVGIDENYTEDDDDVEGEEDDEEDDEDDDEDDEDAGDAEVRTSVRVGIGWSLLSFYFCPFVFRVFCDTRFFLFSSQNRIITFFVFSI